MANKAWKGFLSFGILNIPVYLCVAARDKRVELHSYHEACNTQVKMPKYCPKCETMLQPTEIYRGFNAGDGIVKLTEAELDAITPATGREMKISHCVPFSQVDPVYLGESFYLLPDDAGQKAYSLLCKSLAASGRVAIAQLTKSSREHVVLIRPCGQGLMIHYLWYAAEIARVPEFEGLTEVKLSANEMKQASQLIELMDDGTSFNDLVGEFEDGYYQRVNTLIASKLDDKIQPPVSVKASVTTHTQDISGALSASIAAMTSRRSITVPKNKKTKKAA